MLSFLVKRSIVTATWQLRFALWTVATKYISVKIALRETMMDEIISMSWNTSMYVKGDTLFNSVHSFAMVVTSLYYVCGVLLKITHPYCLSRLPINVNKACLSFLI